MRTHILVGPKLRQGVLERSVLIVRSIASIFILILAAGVSAAAADGNKLEPIGALTDAGAPEAVRSALEAKGYRVTGSDGSLICELWLRSQIPPQEKKEVSGAIYTELGDSSLIGVVSLPKGGNDFRGQGIKPGLYTLRYAVHPTDGNHMGISPYRDFLLLVPAAMDTEVGAKPKFEELSKLSAKAAGTNHPTRSSNP